MHQGSNPCSSASLPIASHCSPLSPARLLALCLFSGRNANANLHPLCFGVSLLCASSTFWVPRLKFSPSAWGSQGGLLPCLSLLELLERIVGCQQDSVKPRGIQPGGIQTSQVSFCLPGSWWGSWSCQISHAGTAFPCCPLGTWCSGLPRARSGYRWPEESLCPGSRTPRQATVLAFVMLLVPFTIP